MMVKLAVVRALLVRFYSLRRGWRAWRAGRPFRAVRAEHIESGEYVDGEQFREPCTPDETLPRSVMDLVWWDFKGGPYETRESFADVVTLANQQDSEWDWRPDAVVVTAPRVLLQLDLLAIFQSPELWTSSFSELAVESSSVAGVSQLDVLWAIQDFIDRNGHPSPDRYFEGLDLLAAADIPIYRVAIGS
jgi:hypothetical protein